MAMRAGLVLVLAGAASAGEPSFADVFDPARFPERDARQAAFDRAAAARGVHAAIPAFRAFEPVLAALRERMERDYATYAKLSAEWWGWRRAYEAEHERKHGRPPGEYPVPPGLNKAFLDSEKAFRASRALLLKERLFHEWALGRTEALLGSADPEKLAAALARGLSDRSSAQRLRCARLARAAGSTAAAAAAAERETHPGVLAALAEAAPTAELLSHPAWPVRAGAIRGAARLGTREAAGWLVARLGAEEGRLRDDLVDALRGMSGEDIGGDPAPWRAWWEALPADWARGEGAPGAKGPLDEPQAPGAFSEGPAEFFGIRSSTRAAVFCVQGGPGFEAMREEVRRSVATLPEGTLFGAVVYGGKVSRFKGSLVPATASTRAALSEWLEGLAPAPGADLHAGLEAALDLAGGRGKEPPAADTIFLAALTPPPEGTLFEDPLQVMHEVVARNALLGIRIHAFGPSEGGDGFYLQRLCAQFGGAHRQPE